MRLASLHALGILDTPAEPEFDALARAASLGCGAPIASLTLVDGCRQWFKANVGLPGTRETPRETAFCAHAILSDELLEIPDARMDLRFADNPLVTGEPGIRFYAGVPLRLSDGNLVGTLCVIDLQPRQFDDHQREILRCLALTAAQALESWRDRQVLRRSTRELLAYEERLRHLYEATPAMMHSIDAEGNLVFVSDVWLAQLGYTREEVIGRKSIDFLTEQSRAFALREVIPQFHANGRVDAIAYQMVRKDGVIIDVLLSAVLERFPDGRPRRKLAVIENVTQRRQTERVLATERQRMAHLITGTAAGTWEWNVQTGALLLNERWAQILGTTLEDLAPLSIQTWHDHMHPDDARRAAAAFAQHVAGDSEHYRCELRLRHRDGHWVWVVSRGAVMISSADGRPEWMYGTITDISDRKQQEEALRKSEDFLDRTGRVAGVGGWELDLATGEVHWSAETCRLHGLPPGHQPTLDEATAFFAPAFRPAFRDAIAQCAAGAAPSDMELPLIRADGRRIWVRAIASAGFADGKPVRVTGALLDVTERVAEREALKQASRRMAMATESGGIGIWDWDIVNDVMIWDDGMYSLYGIPPGHAECAYGLWLRHLHPDDRAGAEQAVRDGIDGIKSFNTAFRVVWRDGSIHYLRGAGQVTRDADGRALRMIGTNWDITTERVLAEEVLRQSVRTAEAAERETALFRNSPDVLYIIGVSGSGDAAEFTYETFSPALTPITGWQPADLVGRRPDECLPAATASAVLANYHRCLAAGTTIEYAEQYDTLKGKRAFEGSITPIRHQGSGRVVRLAGLLRDVTERNRMQAAQLHDQKMATVGRLASGVAHDFNNILQGISGSLELIQDEIDAGTRANEFAEMALRSAKRGANLTHHLLSFARKQTLQPRDVALPGLLSDIGKLLRTMSGNITIRTHMEAAVPMVRADPGQLQTALLNLGINGCHAMPEGGALVLDARAQSEQGRDWVVIAVTDTGTGMDAATLAQAVEPFFTTKGLQGTGLGLSMVHGFAAQSGGRLHITSAPGEGTTVALYLPAAPASAPEELPAPRRHRRDDARILLVDDDPDVLVTTAAFLENSGFDVLRAANGNEALALLADTVWIDAVIADYAMPGINGADLISEARVSRPGLPAIIISGFAELTEARALSEDQITLSKPFQRDDLVTILRRLLGSGTGPKSFAPGGRVVAGLSD